MTTDEAEKEHDRVLNKLLYASDWEVTEEDLDLLEECNKILENEKIKKS